MASSPSDFDCTSWHENLCFEEEPGPRTTQELAEWDTHYAHKMLHNGLARALMHLGRGGLFFATDYSGYESPREGLRIQLAKLCQIMVVPSLAVHFVRSCDQGKLQQKVLLEQSKQFTDCEACVFGDIDERLDAIAKQWVDGVAPTKQMKAADAIAANADIEVIADSVQMIF